MQDNRMIFYFLLIVRWIIVFYLLKYILLLMVICKIVRLIDQNAMNKSIQMEIRQILIWSLLRVVHGEPVMNNIITNTNFIKSTVGLKVYIIYIIHENHLEKSFENPNLLWDNVDRSSWWCDEFFTPHHHVSHPPFQRALVPFLSSFLMLRDQIFAIWSSQCRRDEGCLGRLRSRRDTYMVLSVKPVWDLLSDWVCMQFFAVWFLYLGIDHRRHCGCVWWVDSFSGGSVRLVV
jgi:hypothetical protein